MRGLPRVFSRCISAPGGQRLQTPESISETPFRSKTCQRGCGSVVHDIVSTALNDVVLQARRIRACRGARQPSGSLKRITKASYVSHTSPMTNYQARVRRNELVRVSTLSGMVRRLSRSCAEWSPPRVRRRAHAPEDDCMWVSALLRWCYWLRQ